MSEARPATQAPFPDIRGSRVEGLFLAAPQHDMHTCSLCHKRRRPHSALSSIPNINSEHFGQERKRVSATKEPLRQDGDAQHGSEETDRLPPQTVLARVLRELEDDFTHYKAIYVELADQYKLVDAASNVAKRNVLAQHVHEIVDVLEQKGDQIASLYELLSYRDQVVPETSD